MFTLKGKLRELEAKLNFAKYSLPIIVLPNLPWCENVNYSNTAVKELEMRHLLFAVRETERFSNTVIVEIGAYRGETTKCLANATKRRVIAVDPYIGYGGSEADFEQFKKTTAGINNILLYQKTSGEAARSWNYGPISLIFIDAVHDYINTAFDIQAWSKYLIDGGILALHDTDNRQFAGTRKAAFESCSDYKLIAHPLDYPLDCTIFQRKLT